MAEKIKLTDFDPADYLTDAESVMAYLEEAFATNDSDFIADALGVVARAKGMAEISKKIGMSRESLYKALGPKGNPQLATILKVMSALGLELHPRPAKAEPRKQRMSRRIAA